MAGAGCRRSLAPPTWRGASAPILVKKSASYSGTLHSGSASATSLAKAADQARSGRLFVPGADEDGGNIDENLVETWTLSGNVVRLQHEADTFIRDMPFEFGNDRLTGEQTFSGTTIRVVLTRR